ncbi:uncharacterized protein LOC141703488 isoform X2 [Apium graveolens]|uniref:uncharacterized protein LOC141703488 isoform X2 n=1 Tax=Apium graveolens TaxID=4045 RepID=UPI003D7929C8
MMKQIAETGESNLMQFPAHDGASLHKMMQQCIMQAAVLHNSAIEQPSPYINHWSHEHQLELGNKLEDTELQICNGCTKPISLVDDIFYECNSCSFFLHRSCAQFPKMIEHHLAGKLVGSKFHEFATFRCHGCSFPSNGIVMWNETTWLDIVCASLPTKIKHGAHRHLLNQVKSPDDYFCKGCLYENKTEKKEAIVYGCEKCEFYLHIRCLLLPHLVKHRWDEHPLYLILSVKNVADHPHEFDCEFCSKQIYPNTWFYHCNVCDLSFHTLCIDPYYRYSNMKFGATLIYGASHPHPHGLTLILNRKKRRCKICGEDVAGLVLECSPCKYIEHHKCFIK